jgi:hypothetical protein
VRDRVGQQWAALHRNPNAFVDGGWREPEPTQLAVYLQWLSIHQPRAAQQLAAASGLSVSGPPGLLEKLEGFERLLVVGQPGAGKTTLLQHVISGLDGRVVVLDPHDDRNTWPSNAEVIGGGQDYEAIEDALVYMRSTVRARYQERHEGRSEFDPEWLILDEWSEIFQALPGAAEHYRSILTGGRKVSTGLALGAHSDRVHALGLDGRGDMKKAFYIVRLTGDRRVGIKGTLEYGDSGEQPVSLPGPYRPGALALPEPMSEQERRILELAEQGMAHWKIGEQVYNSSGGYQTERVREVLRSHGRL